MPEYTNALGLYKPNRADSVPVDTSLAENFDKIDSQLGSGLTDSEGNKFNNLGERLDGMLAIIEGKAVASPSEFGAVGDGATDDTNAFEALEAKKTGLFINLEGKTYLTSKTFSQNFYTNGSFLVNGNEVVSPFGMVQTANTNAFGGRNAGMNNDKYALYLTGAGGYANTGFGAEALESNVKGWRNTAFGFQAMKDNIVGQNNTAFGDSALEHNVGEERSGELNGGSRNTAFGSYALRYNINGIGNVGVGRNAGHANESGDYNTAVGTNAYSGSVQAGGTQDRKQAHYNNAFGYNALFNTNASDNVGVGSHAGYNNSAGRFNVLLGNSAGRANINGNRNVAVGYSALLESSGSDNTGVGTNALGNATDVNSSTAIGDNALMFDVAGNPLLSATYVTGLGKQSRVSGDYQVQLGTSAQTTYAYGAVQSRSDKRDKADIKDTELGLDFILSLRPVDYRWDYRDDYIEVDEETGKAKKLKKDGSKKRMRFHHGFIAQDIEKLIKDSGKDFGGFQDHSKNGGADVKSVGYEEMIAPLVKAVQDLHEIVRELQEENKKLREKDGE